MKKKTESKDSPKPKDSPKLKGSPKPKASVTKAEKKDFLVVGLGASAGGVKALQEFFASMPPNLRSRF